MRVFCRERRPLSLVEGLRRLEYRGYDSAGVAILNGAGLRTIKRSGKIAELVSALATRGVRVQVALAPAGSGKTTAMATLAKAWRGGGGQVVGGRVYP